MAIRKGKFNKHQLGLFFLLDACQRNAAGWSTAVWPANAKLPLPHRRSSITRPCCSIERSSAKLLVFTCTSKFERSTGSESEHVDALGLRAVEVIICMITRDFSVISMTSQASLSLCLSQKSLTHNIGSASALPIIGESLTAKTCMIVINSTLGWRICENSVGEEVECLLVQFHAWYTEIAKWELSWCMKLYSKSQRWVHSNAKHIIMNRMRRPSCLISVTLLFLFEFLEWQSFSLQLEVVISWQHWRELAWKRQQRPMASQRKEVEVSHSLAISFQTVHFLFTSLLSLICTCFSFWVLIVLAIFGPGSQMPVECRQFLNSSSKAVSFAQWALWIEKRVSSQKNYMPWCKGFSASQASFCFFFFSILHTFDQIFKSKYSECKVG